MPQKKTKPKAVREDWILFDQEEWKIRGDLFKGGSLSIPIVVFINKKTSEVKMFSKVNAYKIGLDNLEF